MTDSLGGASNENRASQGRLVAASSAVPSTYQAPYGQLGYGASVPDEGNDLVPLVLDLLRILFKRKWLIVTIVAAFVAVGAVRTLLVVPLYTATVRLQIDREGTKVVERGNISPTDSWDYDFIKTQHELLLSRAMAERVASSLKLGEDPDFFKPRQISLTDAVLSLINVNGEPAQGGTSEKSGMERAAAAIVMTNRSVQVVIGSRMVDLRYDDPNPARAQKIVSAFADAYVASNLDKRFQANAYAKTFLEDQLKQLKLRLEESEKVLLDFAQKEQIVVVTEKSSIAESNLASANAALGALVAERIKNEQAWKQVESANAITLPQLLTNTVIAGLRDARNLLVRDYQEKLETFKPGYPLMVQIKNKIAEIDRQLATEVKTVKSSFKAAYESSKNQEIEMQQQIEILKGEVLDLQKRSIQYNILKREVDTSRSLYDGLLQRYNEVGVASGAGSNNVFVVDKAELPGFPSSPHLSRALMLSFMFGLGAGIATAYLLERLDDTVKTADQVERVSGLATLGIIPKVREKTIEAEFIDPRSALSESYRSLCTSLQFSTESGLPKTLLVTSTGPAEGKSYTSLAVARHFATLGLKVLLVDADLRNPSLHKKLGLDNAKGLSNYLTGGSTPPEVFQGTPVPNLIFMASGPPPPNAADLLGGSRLVSLLSVGLEVFDFILLDGPPVMGLADAPLLSNAAAGTVFVVGSSEARMGMVRGALKRLQFARAPIIGTVLTKFDVKAAGYGYGYGYGGYGYGADQATAGQSVAVATARESA